MSRKNIAIIFLLAVFISFECWMWSSPPESYFVICKDENGLTVCHIDSTQENCEAWIIDIRDMDKETVVLSRREMTVTKAEYEKYYIVKGVAETTFVNTSIDF